MRITINTHPLSAIFLLSVILLTTVSSEVLGQKNKNRWENLLGDNPSEHWHNYLKKDVKGWEIKDGILSTPGKQGDIVTNATYDNFELEVEWKIDTGGNSGIFYYVVEDPKYRRISETGPEFQIIDNDNYPVALTESQKTGSLSDVKAPQKAAVKAIGKWNKTRILVQNGAAEHWLNGKKILSYQIGSEEWDRLVAASKFAEMDYGKTRSGQIALQDHGNKTWFRNIRIRRL